MVETSKNFGAGIEGGFKDITKQKLVIAIMGQNCEKFIGMCLESVKEADAIVYCDGGSDDKTIEITDEFRPKTNRLISIHQTYDQEDKQMNGKQRNFYLEYVKKNYPGWWCLALDADEVVEDLSKIKDWINKYDSISDLYPCVSVKMRHFIGDLGHEDATVPKHYVLHRLFKIVPELYYPLGEHPVLQCSGKEPRKYECNATTIWHMAYIPNLWDIKKRYDNHMKKSEMHTPEFLKQWYFAHLFGRYPKSEVNPIDIPEVILDNFGINKDEFYFANRGVEAKHFIMITDWINHLNVNSAIDFGCGRAPYGYAINKIMGDTFLYKGVELSKFAVDNAFVPITRGDITTYVDDKSDYDLALAIDVLEHLDDRQLDQAMLTLKQHSNKYILFSVPVIGDPNLDNDKTHIQRKTREEWIKLWESYGLKIIETPKDWAFSHQLFIGEKQ